MIVVSEPLTDKDETAARIKYLVNRFHGDLDKIYIPYNGSPIRSSELPLEAYYDFVRLIPYRRDPTRPYPREVVSRPYYLLKHNHVGLDCKKKAILIGSYLHYNDIPYRFIASSQRRDKKVHHIFPQAKIGGTWRNIDATYPEFTLFDSKNDVTYSEVL